jgi:hypothetical protein
LIEFEDFPFLKKDIFFFNGQTYDNLGLLEAVLRKKHGDEVSSSTINQLLQRGRYSDSDILLRAKYLLGLR